MACFLIPTTEAIVSTIVTKVVKSKESTTKIGENDNKIKFSHKLKWLSNMLWGGSALLAFEHVWHGEIVPWYPFLTAMNNPTDKLNMLHEMSTVGVGMSLLVTAVWIGMVLISSALEKNPEKLKPILNERK